MIMKLKEDTFRSSDDHHDSPGQIQILMIMIMILLTSITGFSLTLTLNFIPFYQVDGWHGNYLPALIVCEMIYKNENTSVIPEKGKWHLGTCCSNSCKMIFCSKIMTMDREETQFWLLAISQFQFVRTVSLVIGHCSPFETS